MQKVDEVTKYILSMGYRAVKNNYFLKPVGFSCFVIRLNEDSVVLELCAGLSENLKELVWWTDSIISLDSFTLQDIKNFECYNKQGLIDCDSEFEFLTPDQFISL